MSKNANLHRAKKNKKDEFYTQIDDISAEMIHYEQHFKGKTIYMNCDDPSWSNFWRYFHLNFVRLGLKKIISTHYEYENVSTYKMEYEGGNDADFKVGVRTNLEKNGDFRSSECIEILKESDIIITNPPFSLFREFVSLLMKYDKKFIIIGNQNAITYKEIFPLIKENKLWLGFGFKGNVGFFGSPYQDIAKASQHKEGLIRVSGVMWFTNLDHSKKHKLLETSYYYSKRDSLYPDLYPKYDNYDAINVDKVSEIPMDYNGIMGVPITFLDKYNPKQFEIIGLSSKDNCKDVPRLHNNTYYNGYIRGKVVTRVESNMPLLLGNIAGGTKCTKQGFPDIYQLYWRMFIRRKII